MPVQLPGPPLGKNRSCQVESTMECARCCALVVFARDHTSHRALIGCREDLKVLSGGMRGEEGEEIIVNSWKQRGRALKCAVKWVLGTNSMCSAREGQPKKSKVQLYW